MNRIQDADSFTISKENIIMTGTVQKKLPYLIFLKDGDEAFYVYSSFQQQKNGSYSANARFIRYLCANSEELRDMTVNEIESVAITAWKAGKNRLAGN